MNARFLLIEDSSDDAALVVEALRDHGFEPEWVRIETSEALREMLSERQWDAVLCNCTLPGMSAEEALQIVRAHDTNLPFILVSGTVSAAVAVGMMRQGMHEYVMKDDLARLGPATEREIRDSIHRKNEALARAELFELQTRFRNTFEPERRQSEQEQQRLRTQIEELNRIESLGKLAGNMAHEFNNVLMGIQPFTEVIRRLSPGNEKIDQAVRFIFDAVQRGQRISQEILRFARPTPPARTEVDVDDFLDRVAKVGEGIVGAAHRLVVEPADQPSRCTIDREQLIQVFTNLMINARDAMEPGGTITISAERNPAGTKYPFGVVDRPERYVHIRVSDTGPGIPPEIGNRIFEPMFTTKRTGTGLGLAIAHQIVTTHEGCIFLDSEIGTGTTFHLFLPLIAVQDFEGKDRIVSSAGSDR